MKTTANYPNTFTFLAADDSDPGPRIGKRKISIKYPPISEHPDYQTAHDKLVQFAQQKAEQQTRLDLLQAKHAESLEQTQQQDKDAADIGVAEQIISGIRPESETAQIQTLTKNIAVLDRAETAQRKVLKSVCDELSRQAGVHFMAQHKAEVARLKEAIQALHDANKQESVIRDDLVALGYMGSTLPHMGYMEAHDPNDYTGSGAFYWLRHTADYLQSPEQKATATRKNRLSFLPD